MNAKIDKRWNLKCREMKSLKIHRIAMNRKKKKMNERAELCFMDFIQFPAWCVHEICIDNLNVYGEKFTRWGHRTLFERHFFVNFKWLQYGRMKFLFRTKALKMREWKLRLCHKHHLVIAFPRKSINPLFFVISPFALLFTLLAMTYIYNFIDKWLSCATWWWTPEYKTTSREIVNHVALLEESSSVTSSKN